MTWAWSRSICDRVAVMYAGQVVETGPTGAVIGEPAAPLYARAPWYRSRSLSDLSTDGFAPIKGTVPELIDLPDRLPVPGVAARGRKPACRDRIAMQDCGAGRQVRCIARRARGRQRCPTFLQGRADW